MPKQMRWQLKQELTYASGNLERAQDKVLRVAKPFEHVHDDLFAMLIQIASSIHLTNEALKKFSDSI